MPTADLDIWRSAKLLVDQHGSVAPIRAAQRADGLLAYRVSTALNSPKNDTPECIAPAA